jgi:hypothetical protein
MAKDIQIRQGHWAIVDLIGKGGHIRTVPMPLWVKSAVTKWIAAARLTDGRIFRAVSTHGTVWGTGGHGERRLVCGPRLLEAHQHGAT